MSNDAEFVQSALAASNDCIKILSRDGSLLYMSEGGQRVMEVDDFSAVKGRRWADFWEGSGREMALDAIKAASEGQKFRFEGAANTAKGNPRYWDVSVTPIFDHPGSVKNILSVSRDITHLVEAKNQVALISQEAKHRLKNILAIVQAIANQTLKSKSSIEEIKNSLLDRYEALGKAYDLLTDGAWSEAGIVDVVKATVKSHPNSDRIHLEGPELNISSRRALGLSLALHELCTNSTKYGSLSNDLGKVSIFWCIDNNDFVLKWLESDGPLVKIPDSKGFGSQIINRILPAYFNGFADSQFNTKGFELTLRSPAGELTSD